MVLSNDSNIDHANVLIYNKWDRNTERERENERDRERKKEMSRAFVSIGRHFVTMALSSYIQVK